MEKTTSYWFKRKRYGWGWTPATWQGWLTVLAYMFLVIGNAVRTIDAPSVVPFILQTIGLSLVLLYISIKKGEPPTWQWGEKRNEE